MSLPYRPEIDGLRAIAVTAVILFHGGVVPLAGGYAGVDVFFVLSGYLITAILLREIEGGTHSILRFYERRARRILPALAVMLAATSLAAWAVMIPPQLEEYSESLLAVLLFVSNLLFGANSGYFSPALEEAPLLHTWSLAVEEQFYLLFPPLLALGMRRFRRALPFVLAAMALASLGLAEWGSRAAAQANFFFSLSRFWELLAGVLAAYWLHRGPRRQSGALAGLGLGLILAAFVLHGAETRYPGLAALLPVGGAVLLVQHAGPGNIVGRALAVRPMVAVGLISYSAYLWHQPFFAFARILSPTLPSAGLMAGLSGLAFLLAWASWAWIEQPFRRSRLPGRRIFAGTGAALAGLAVVAASGLATQGNDALWRRLHPERAAMLDLIAEARAGATLPADDGSCRFNLTRIDAAAEARIAACAARHGPAAVVLGDSHGIDLFEALRRTGDTPFLLGVTDGGCRPAEGEAACPFGDFAALARKAPRLFAHVLFVQSGAYLLRTPDGGAGSRQIFARASDLAPLPALGVDRPMIDRIGDYLARIEAAGVQVTWLGPRIEPHVSPDRLLHGGCRAAQRLRPGQAEAFARVDAEIAREAAERDFGHVPQRALGFDMARDFMSCERLYWSDGDHWSPAGELRFGRRLAPALPPGFL